MALGIYNPTHSESRIRLSSPLLLASVVVVLSSAAILIWGGQSDGDWRVLAAIAVGIGVLFCLWFWPDFFTFLTLLVFLVANVPMWNVGQFASIGRWAMLGLLTLALLVRSFESRADWSWPPIFLWLGLFLLVAGLSSLYSPSHMLTLLKAWSFACLLLVAALNGGLDVRSQVRNRCRTLEHVYWVAALLVLASAVLLVTVGIQRPDGFFSGPFRNPNSMGLFAALTAPVLLYKVLVPVRKRWGQRFAEVALLAVLLIFSVMSVSRAGILGTALGCGWLLYFYNRRFLALLLAGATLCGLFTWAFSPAYLSALDERYIQKRRYVLAGREVVMQDTWEAATKKLYLGIGFGASEGFSEDFTFGFESWQANREKGNSYLAVLEEVGFGGAVLLLTPIAWVLWRARSMLLSERKRRIRTPEFWVILTFSACMVGGLVDALFETWLTAAGNYETVIFWMAFGILAYRFSVPQSHQSASALNAVNLHHTNSVLTARTGRR